MDWGKFWPASKIFSVIGPRVSGSHDVEKPGNILFIFLLKFSSKAVSILEIKE